MIPASRLSLALAIAAIKEIALKFREIKGEAMIARGYVSADVDWAISVRGFPGNFSFASPAKVRSRAIYEKKRRERSKNGREEKIAIVGGKLSGRLSLFRASEVMGALGDNGRAYNNESAANNAKVRLN